jgi:hypothetical protein
MLGEQGLPVRRLAGGGRFQVIGEDLVEALLAGRRIRGGHGVAPAGGPGTTAV